MLNLAVATQNAEATRKTAAGKRDAEMMEADAVKYRKFADAEGDAKQYELKVKAFGPDGAKILATTMIANMVQRGDKLILDQGVTGIPAITSLITETLGVLKKEPAGGDKSKLADVSWTKARGCAKRTPGFFFLFRLALLTLRLSQIMTL